MFMGKLGHRRSRSGPPHLHERGANLVEFAILMPLLVLLLLGVVEFGWGLAQHLDVRHLAREGGRLATVNLSDTEIKSMACSSDIVDAEDITLIERDGDTNAGGEATLTVSANWDQITGFFSWLLSPSTPITSTVTFRLEQDADAWDGSNLAPCSP